MRTVVLDDQPEVTEWLQRRRALGQDLFDEVWEGDYHVAPNASSGHALVAMEAMAALRPRAGTLRSLGPFDLGVPGDFRVPDGGWVRPDAPLEVYVPTAVAVLEVLSPNDETYAKLGFYADHGVQEVLVAHPTERWVHCHAPARERRPVAWSSVFGISMEDLQALISWPRR